MMTDEELLMHCYNSLIGEYGEIANTLLVETLKLRLAKQYASQLKPTGFSITKMGTTQLAMTTELPVSPAKLRCITNSPWHKE
jgi:DeoR/GlpR family transcriptional regulator of sugar metabolism